MKKAEFEALPITNNVMFDSSMVWDENGKKWWIGEIDGVAYRRPFGGSFSVAYFVVSYEGRREKVSIPFIDASSERLFRAAADWGAKYFGCSVTDLEISASSCDDARP